MIHFNQYDIKSAPEKSKQLLILAKKKFGKIPNLQAVMAESPQLLDGYQLLYDLGSKTSFTPIEIQVIYLAISYHNDCNYCIAAHSFQSEKRDKAPKHIVESLRQGTSLLDNKLNGLSLFAKEMLQSNGKVNDEDVVSFLEIGFTKKQVLEIVLLLTVKVLSNYTNHIAKPELDDAFASFKWYKL